MTDDNPWENNQSNDDGDESGNPYHFGSRSRPPQSSGTGMGGAFAKGGCGCLILFLVVGLLTVLVGGRMHLDLGGAICLFVIGGIIGLIVLAVYNSGLNDGRRNR